jgi:hypothetical protein
MPRGGKRPGAGRPKLPNTKIAMTFKVRPIVREFIKSQPNQAATVEAAIAKSKPFKDWLAARDKL